MCNKVILAICAIAISITFVACSATNVVSQTDTVVPSSLEKIPSSTGNIRVAVVSGDTLYNPKTLEEVEKLSGYIVKGRLKNDAKQKLYTPDAKTVIFGVTVSSFEITKVYKGNLKEGDKIPIAERYYTLEENGGTTRYELDYAPSISGKEYIFFLNKAPDKNEFMRGFYSPVIKETGRYPVITQKDSNFSKRGLMSANELNLVKTEPSTYQKIYNQVIDKYMK
jgi:hypothetical protein